MTKSNNITNNEETIDALVSKILDGIKTEFPSYTSKHERLKERLEIQEQVTRNNIDRSIFASSSVLLSVSLFIMPFAQYHFENDYSKVAYIFLVFNLVVSLAANVSSSVCSIRESKRTRNGLYSRNWTYVFNILHESSFILALIPIFYLSMTIFI